MLGANVATSDGSERPGPAAEDVDGSAPLASFNCDQDRFGGMLCKSCSDTGTAVDICVRLSVRIDPCHRADSNRGSRREKDGNTAISVANNSARLHVAICNMRRAKGCRPAIAPCKEEWLGSSGSVVFVGSVRDSTYPMRQ